MFTPFFEKLIIDISFTATNLGTVINVLDVVLKECQSKPIDTIYGSQFLFIYQKISKFQTTYTRTNLAMVESRKLDKIHE